MFGKTINNYFDVCRPLTVLACGIVCLLSTTAGAAGAHPRSSRARPPSPPAARGPALKAMIGPLSMPDGSSAFPLYHRLGVQVLELRLLWDGVAATAPRSPTNPADPAYGWPGELDSAIAQAARYGIQIALIVEQVPAWANGRRDPSWAPTRPADFAGFLTAASRRYPAVHRWMIFNEVTYKGKFNPMPPASPVGPRRYAELLDAAYGALKAASPFNLVIGGMTFSGGTIGAARFLRWMRLPNGAPPRLDYYGHNPYSTRYPNLGENPYSPNVIDINDIDTLQAQITTTYRNTGHVPPLWLSEFGISDHADRSFDYYVSRPIQARWVTAAFKLVDSVPYVAALGWFELLDEPDAIPGHLTEGLITADGQLKPAFYAYQAAP
jgi:Glycosyl hydrolase catalytic core